MYCKNKASNDLNELIEKGLLFASGQRGTEAFYKLK